jgi:hypothetical protein
MVGGVGKWQWTATEIEMGHLGSGGKMLCGQSWKSRKGSGQGQGQLRGEECRQQTPLNTSSPPPQLLLGLLYVMAASHSSI